ncbi:nitrite reductase, copper-containing [Halobacteriales archaeon QS_1_68_20]|nr:MAG: nitrite reductase, copper-containing [Halobacteriales archaeon QS_1_68_20]
MLDSTRRRVLKATGAGGATAVAGCVGDEESTNDPESTSTNTDSRPAGTDAERVAADPTDVPDPVDWDDPRRHEVTLRTEEVRAEVEPGVTFDFMTFDGRIPGPMIRVRQGDTVALTLENPPESNMPHNVDLHAVYGSGGGAIATSAAPGEEAKMEFEATYPGAYIYHCAVDNLDYHISSGMFGMILVEPEEGLPEVDREFYLGQHEIYTDGAVGEGGKHGFNFQAMKHEDPTYVVFNGEKFALTPDRDGAMQAETGETARVYLATGGPNLPSYFHPIGNVWSKAWPNGAVAGDPDRYAQTMTVPPGSCFVGEMEFPVAETVKLVDHALSRVARKGLMAAIAVEGEDDPGVFDPDP